MIRQRSHLVRLTLLMVLLFLCVLLWIQPLEAQESSIPRDKAVLREMVREWSQRSSSLNLTEAQKKSLEDLRCMYAKEAIPMRGGLFALKIELRHLLLDPSTQPQMLFRQQKKISALQAKLEELSLSYQVKARSVFTKEQLERLPQEWAFEMGLTNETLGMDRFYRR
jgi:Spy/CpxP family protein refolding chaperone